MTKFDIFYKKILEDCSVTSTFGTHNVEGDSYAPGDSRIPKLLSKRIQKRKKGRLH